MGPPSNRAHDRRMWNDDGQAFKAFSISSALDLVISAVSCVNPAVGMVLGLAKAALVLAADVHQGKDLGSSLLKAGCSAVGAVAGFAVSKIPGGKDLLGNLVMGLVKSVALSTTNSFMRSFEIKDGQLGWNSKSFVNGVVGKDAMVGYITGAVTSAVGGAFGESTKDLKIELNGGQMASVSSLGSFIGSSAGTAVKYGLTGEADFNVFNTGIFGGKLQMGLLEMHFGKNGFSMNIGNGGQDISIGTLAAAANGLGVLKKVSDINEYAKTVSGVTDLQKFQKSLRMEYGHGDSAAQAQLNRMLAGVDIFGFGDLGTANAQTTIVNGKRTVTMSNNLFGMNAEDMAITMQHEAYRDGVKSADQARETDIAVISHVLMAKRIKDAGGTVSSDSEREILEYQTGGLRALQQWARGNYDSSGDYMKLLKSGLIAYTNDTKLTSEAINGYTVSTSPYSLNAEAALVDYAGGRQKMYAMLQNAVAGTGQLYSQDKLDNMSDEELGSAWLALKGGEKTDSGWTFSNGAPTFSFDRSDQNQSNFMGVWNSWNSVDGVRLDGGDALIQNIFTEQARATVKILNPDKSQISPANGKYFQGFEYYMYLNNMFNNQKDSFGLSNFSSYMDYTQSEITTMNFQGNQIRINRNNVPAISQLESELRDTKVQVDHFWVPRPINGREWEISPHSLGIAGDFLTASNPMVRRSMNEQSWQTLQTLMNESSYDRLTAINMDSGYDPVIRNNLISDRVTLLADYTRQSISLAEEEARLNAIYAARGSNPNLPQIAIDGLGKHSAALSLYYYFRRNDLYNSAKTTLELNNPSQSFQAVIQAAGGVTAYKSAWTQAEKSGNTWSWLKSGFSNMNTTVYDVLVNKFGWTFGGSSLWYKPRNPNNSLWDSMHLENNYYLGGK